MAGIIPNPDAGAVVIRDGDGTCLTPAGVSNTYCPPATFTTSCEVAALPDGCTSRIQPKQINAIESELLCLAVKLNPNGNWNCGSVCNLSTLFEQWAAGSYVGSMNKRVQAHLCNTTAMNQAQLDALPAASFIMCDGAGNIRRFTGRFFANAQAVVDAICGDVAALADLVDCLPTVLVTNTVAGHRIATVTNEQGVAVDIRETITTLIDNNDGTFTYTNENGVQTILVDTNVTNNQFIWDIPNNRFQSTVTEDGIDHVANLVVPLGNIQCGDRAFIRDALTGELLQKPIRPSARYKRVSTTITHAEVSGAALDALVGTDVVDISVTSTVFATDQLACYPQHEMIMAIRAGSWRWVIGTPGDHWSMGFDQPTGLINNQFLNPTLQFMNAGAGAVTHQFAQQQGTGTQQIAGGVPYDLRVRVNFGPNVYTPHINNSIVGFGHVVTLTRREIVGAP